MWTNKQFWLDSTWRAFRTFCQTLAALLAASFSGLLTTTGVTSSSEIPHTPWLGFLYASVIAGLISLLQSIDRERAVDWVVGQSPSPTIPVPPTKEVVETFPELSDPSSDNYQPPTK
jgi:hypothetical protein